MSTNDPQQAVPDEGAALPLPEGWVVARRNGFGAWYILSNHVHATRDGACLTIVDDLREVVVLWQGTQADTLHYRSHHALLPAGQLP